MSSRGCTLSKHSKHATSICLNPLVPLTDLLPRRQSLHLDSLSFFPPCFFFQESNPLLFINAAIGGDCFVLISIVGFLLRCFWWSTNTNKLSGNLSIRMGLIKLGSLFHIWFWARSPGSAIVFWRSGLLKLDRAFYAWRLTLTSGRGQKLVPLPVNRYDRNCHKNTQRCKIWSLFLCKYIHRQLYLGLLEW